MAIADKILQLTRQLKPTGRAFKMPFTGKFEGLYRALAISEAQAYDDLRAILNSLIPDNASFTTDDATDWERRLGLYSNPNLSLTIRKDAILRKMKDPGANPAKQHYLYLQFQLQTAGFDVWVHENRFPDSPTGYVTMTPSEFTGADSIQHGDVQHGDAQHGEPIFDFVVNYIDKDIDSNFNIGGNLKATFFIGGEVAGSYATVDADREDEFRHLILQLKPVNSLAWLIVNYY